MGQICVSDRHTLRFPIPSVVSQKAINIKTLFSVSILPSVDPRQLCALAELGCTRKAGNS